jgi:hypothetical protein
VGLGQGPMALKRLSQAIASLSADRRRDICFFIAAIIFLSVSIFLPGLRSHGSADPQARLALAWARRRLRRAGERRRGGPHLLPGCSRAARPPLDVGERPQWRPAPRCAWILADARGCDGGVREKLAAGVTLGQQGGPSIHQLINLASISLFQLWRPRWSRYRSAGSEGSALCQRAIGTRVASVFAALKRPDVSSKHPPRGPLRGQTSLK